MMKLIKEKMIFLAFICSIVISGLSAQSVNQTWIFGNNQFVFDSSAPEGFIRTEISNNFRYNSATLSDSNTGDISFFTDGVNVYDRNSNIMNNGTELLGPDVSGTNLGDFYDLFESCDGNATNQGTLILQKPGTSDVFYVITNVRTDFKSCSAGPSSLYNLGIKYAEVDMSLNNGLGGVISKNNLISNIGSKTMTVTTSNDLSGYWLVVENGIDSFHSYEINSSGINSSSPTSSTFPGFNFECIKISPDGTRLVAFDNSLFNRLPVLFDFNDQTGSVSNLFEFADVPFNSYYEDLHGSPAGIEFSPNSNIIYFLNSTVVSGNSDFEGGLAMYNIATNEFSGGYASNFDEFDLPPGVGGMALQQGPDGKIYAMFYKYFYQPNYAYVLYNDLIGIIEEPDIWSPDVMPMNFVWTPDKMVVSVMFQQTIAAIAACISDRFITENVTTGETDIQDASNTVTAVNTIFSGGTAEYDAGYQVILSPDFFAESGCEFRAYIDVCSAPQPKSVAHSDIEIRAINDKLDQFNNSDLIYIYPNPTSAQLSIESKNYMVEIELINQSGFQSLLMDLTDNKSKSRIIDIQDLPTGIYYLKVIFEDGREGNKKLIKE